MADKVLPPWFDYIGLLIGILAIFLGLVLREMEGLLLGVVILLIEITTVKG